ncbi:MAG TPA: ATP-binding protein [Puia sp.]|nr:ATP-binding protein [Puia sp.]
MPLLKKVYILLTALILGSIVGLIVLAIRYNNAFTETSRLLRHTIIVMDEGQKALIGVHDLELGRVGSSLQLHLAALKKLTSDNPIQQARADSLLNYSFKAGIALPGAQAQASPRAGYADSLRDVLLRLQAEEGRLLAIREKANAGSRDLTWNTLFILMAVSLVLIGFSGYLILYQFNRRLTAEKGLREAEQRFSLLVRKEKNYAIFMLDAAGRVMSWNEGAENIKGYTEEEVLGQPSSIFYTEEEIQREEPANNLKKAAEEGQYECIGLRKRKDGSVFWADVVFTAVRDDTGMITGYVKITKDITQQKMLEEEMRNSLIREKELNEMKSRFVTLASHEFKTPLSVILSSVSLIDKYNTPESEDNRHRHVQRIKSNVNNLRQILNDFLSVEKLEAGIVKNNPVPADLVQLTTDILADMEDSYRGSQRIIFEIHGEPRLVAVDTHLLQNILNNLVSNALKYSPSPSEVRLTLYFGTGTVTFVVSDSGIGIPPEDLPHLFERFFRARNTTGISGTGLGLSIVKKYLDLLEGTIEVSSQSGAGTTITITLPAPLLAGALPAAAVSQPDIR